MKTSTAFRTSASASTLGDDEYICWSRMQAEAGQALSQIVARKERERKFGKGLFFWGVGNAPAVITNVLVRAGLPVRVVFSIMKSKPKLSDSAPDRVVAWRRYVDANGVERSLPPHALITSRADSSSGPKKVHYALMCYSSEELALHTSGELFDPSAFRNAGASGAPVGASQVTALLRRVEGNSPTSDYKINLSAWLTGGYWVRLTDPVEVEPAKRALLARLDSANEAEWVELVATIRSETKPRVERSRDTSLLI